MRLFCLRLQKTAEFPQLQFLVGHRHLFRGAEFIPWSRQFVRPGILQVLHIVVDALIVLVEQVHFPVVTQRPIPMVWPVWHTIEIRSCSTRRMVDVPVVQIELFSWCRRSGDSRDLTVALWWSWADGDFLGPGGRVHRDTAPIIRCKTVVAYRQRHVIYTASGPPPPPPPPPP